MDIPFDFLSINESTFEACALTSFAYQYQHVAIYRQYCDLLNKNPSVVKSLDHIPFLPVSFFKTHKVLSDEKQATITFESSTTSGTEPSRHAVADIELYIKSFRNGFEKTYGDISEYAVLGLLPSYIERGGSSLVYMIDDFIHQSSHTESGFFLTNFEELKLRLLSLAENKTPTLLLGVTYALLDFAEQNPISLAKTIVMETGGMKGRRKEMTRAEVHHFLKKQFSQTNIHSEYGMTELLSQAYSKGEGIFECPPWMHVHARDMYAPTLRADTNKTGGINVIDLANFYSCSFIETSDMGKVFDDGKFEILGRLQSSDVRGCNLMYDL